MKGITFSLSLGQIMTIIAIIGVIFGAGQAWENHNQRILALEKKTDYLHGTFTMPER